MNLANSLLQAPLMPWFIACAIGAAGLLLVLRPGRRAMRQAGAVIGLAGFGMLLAQGLKFAGTVEMAGSTPFLMAFAAVGVIGAVRVITHPRPVFAAIYFVLTVLAAAATFLVLDAEFLAFALIIVYAGAILITYMFVLMLAHQSPEDEIGRIGAEDYDRVPREPFAAVFLGFFLLAALGTAVERTPEMAMEESRGAEARFASRQAAALQSMPETMLAQAKVKEPTATGLARDAQGGVSAVDGAMVQVRVNAEGGAVRAVAVDPASAVSNVQMVGMDLVAKYPASLELAGVILLMAMFGAVVLARRQIELGEDERRKAAGLGSMVLDLPDSERGAA
jgi:NADH-quinone oxidoreductase subunit J